MRPGREERDIEPRSRFPERPSERLFGSRRGRRRVARAGYKHPFKQVLRIKTTS